MDAHNESSESDSDNTDIIDLYNNENNDFDNRKYKFFYKKNLYLDTISNHKNDSNECPICYQTCDDTLNITTLCNHLFHKSCIDEWLDKINNCPICRYEPAYTHNVVSLDKIKNKINDNYHEIEISYIDKYDYICYICNKKILYNRYTRTDDLINICCKCFNTTSIDKTNFLIKIKKYDTIYFYNKNLNSLILDGINILSEIYNARTNIFIANTLIYNIPIFNTNHLSIANSRILNFIKLDNILELNLINIDISNINILNTILIDLSKDLTTLVIDKINIIDNFDNIHKPKLNLDISKYIYLKTLKVIFNNNLLFNSFSFDLSNHINLTNLVLKNIIVYDLISENKLNISNNVIILKLNKIVMRKFKINYLDFNNLNNLDILTLKNINIEVIDNLPISLKYIILNKLHLKTIKNIPINCSYLDLSNNKLSNIPNINNLIELFELKLNYNYFESIDNLPINLSILEIKHNKIKNFPNISNIEILNLFNNYIKVIPDNINIEYLNLANNKLSIIDINYNSNIYNLDVSNNNIVNIISLPKNIKKLNCAYNKISNIYLSRYHLKELIINNNQLTELLLKKYSKIKLLNCSNNKIKNLNLSNKNNIISLYYLNIKSNQIDKIYLNNISKFTYLNIKNNPNIDIIIQNREYIKIDNFIYSIKINNLIHIIKYINKISYLLFNKYAYVITNQMHETNNDNNHS
jgi:hypothetical protein